MSPGRPRHRAVVDCGSNSTRLWLYREGAEPLRLEEVTRLGRGVDATGRLDDDRLAACLEVVAGYARRWRDAGVPDAEVVVIATSAVRDATDRDRFEDGIRRVAGVTPQVLAGEDEARASHLGATTALETTGPTLVVDIGGGSTELVIGDPLRATSLQLGTVRLTERHLGDDPPTVDQVAAARHEVGAELVAGLATIEVETERARPGVANLVAVAGTATSLAALHAGTTDLAAIHGHRLTADELLDLVFALLARPAARRHELGPLHPGRADVIGAGGLILATLVDLLGVAEVTVSVADVLDGVARPS